MLFQTICSKRAIGAPIIRVIPIRMNFQAAMGTCKKFGGKMFSPIGPTKFLQEAYGRDETHDPFPNCSRDFWAPYKRLDDDSFYLIPSTLQVFLLNF